MVIELKIKGSIFAAIKRRSMDNKKLFPNMTVRYIVEASHVVVYSVKRSLMKDRYNLDGRVKSATRNCYL